MADFEGLIRQALARQNAPDPAVRQRVYESSRRALARMTAAAGMQAPEVIARQHEALENAILGIEEEYMLAEMQEAEEAASRDNAPSWIGRQSRTGQGADARLATREEHFDYPEDAGLPDENPLAADEPQYAEEEYAPGNLDVLPRRRSSFSQAVGVLAVVVAVAVAGWAVYALYASMTTDKSAVSGQTDGAGKAQRDLADGATYITILSPAETAALDTAGRGKADIVNQSNIEMIRLVSLRAENRRGEPALPILLAIAPGVLSQIAGNRVTIEILAKSGSSGPVGFAIGCEFGGEDICGRKRFRVGIQPEAIVFTMNVKPEMATAAKAFLSINTDITSAAQQTGEGDPVDILYARLRLTKG